MTWDWMEAFQSNATKRSAVGAFVAAAVLGLAGCAGMSTQHRTEIGAGTGAGSVVAIGGAAEGGLLGHEWERIAR